MCGKRVALMVKTLTLKIHKLRGWLECGRDIMGAGQGRGSTDLSWWAIGLLKFNHTQILEQSAIWRK